MQLCLQPLQPKIPSWRHMTYADGSIMSSQSRDAQQLGTSFFVLEDINHLKPSPVQPIQMVMDQLIQQQSRSNCYFCSLSAQPEAHFQSTLHYIKLDINFSTHEHVSPLTCTSTEGNSSAY
eukprot:1149228-Pelagomonas_calceolata.AAC.3